MPKVSDAHRAQLRNRLLDAAQTCITRDGVEGFTTRDVATEAGVAAGTLYHYFDTKEAVILAVAERSDSEGLLNLVRSVPPDDKTGRGLLTHMLIEIFEHLDNDDLLNVLRERAVRDAEIAGLVRHYNRHIVDGLEPLIETARSEKTLRDDIDAEALIETVACFFDGLTPRVAAGTVATSNDRIARTFLQLLVRGAVADDDATRSALEADLLDRFQAREEAHK